MFLPRRNPIYGLPHAGGKHPDGVTKMPWSCGHPLWDITSSDTFAETYCSFAIMHAQPHRASSRFCMLRVRGTCIATSLQSTHIFVPVAVETTGAFGAKSILLKDLACRLAVFTVIQVMPCICHISMYLMH